MDEQIRRVINQIEEQEALSNQNIYEGVTVNNQYYEFEERSFFDDQLKIYMPMVFEDMSPEFARIKYPSEDRPQVIKTDSTGGINITLSCIPNGIEDNDILEVKDGVKAILRKLNPCYLFIEDGVETVEEKTVGFIEFKSPTLGQPLYQLRFFLEMDGNVMMGIFSCQFDDYAAWRPLAQQIMKSVRVSPQTALAYKNEPSGGGI
ncbi:hypothetical protein Ga0466249_004542 [Sporomusaceae bacterium BoRhaA]|uniref:hypothetical protein n=1 Tax=Pelorhabdus rhamnosifermentans TaxID=2772457 RepID=UPI001C06499C|nr:hypothetical protein [Pelorhabdus rhamnosifermentans]MBU2703397.1 hypothetical protein [Pelorhabdus rhamnosifermentans]